MELKELLLELREENLPLQRLELLCDKLTHLKSDYLSEIIPLKKEKGLFIYERSVGENKMTHAAAKDAWNAIPQGQRLIEVEGSLKLISNELSGLRHKLFTSL